MIVFFYYNAGDLERDLEADLRKFSFNYTRQGNQESEMFSWGLHSRDLIINVDFTQEGMQVIFINAYPVCDRIVSHLFTCSPLGESPEVAHCKCRFNINHTLIHISLQ